MFDDKLKTAISRIGAREDWRQAFITQLVNYEYAISSVGIDVREEITGPLVDALFDDNEIVRKTLSNGVIFDFLYRSKIARDFVMSIPEHPNHAWRPQTSRILINLAKSARQVVIGGAYFGDHAILIAREIEAAGGVVHAFEPNNEQRAMLDRNARLNALTNIISRSEGLWHNSTTNLKLSGYDSFATAKSVDEGADTFKTVTISDYLESIKADHLDLIELVIEGAELSALQGAERFLAQPSGHAPNIIFAVHSNYVDWTNGLIKTPIAQLLIQYNYTIYGLRDFNSNFDLSDRPIELIPLESIYLDGPPHGFNMVAVKDPTILEGADYLLVSDVSPKYLRHKNPALHHPVDGLQRLSIL